MYKGQIKNYNVEIEKRKFYYRKNLILLEDGDIKEIQVSSMAYSGEKNCIYFISNKDDNHKIKTLLMCF